MKEWMNEWRKEGRTEGRKDGMKAISVQCNHLTIIHINIIKQLSITIVTIHLKMVSCDEITIRECVSACSYSWKQCYIYYALVSFHYTLRYMIKVCTGFIRREQSPKLFKQSTPCIDSLVSQYAFALYVFFLYFDNSDLQCHVDNYMW